jgi:uncharacterized membrane protein YcjF (UPF0283 family)
MDWMTLAITATGAVIFCLWVIIPIREYRTIYRRLQERTREADTRAPRGGSHDGA